MDFEGRAPMSGALDRRIAKIEAAQVPDRGPPAFPWLKPGMSDDEIDDEIEDAMERQAVSERDAARVLAWNGRGSDSDGLSPRERLTRLADLMGPAGAKIIAAQLSPV